MVSILTVRLNDRVIKVLRQKYNMYTDRQMVRLVNTYERIGLNSHKYALKAWCVLKNSLDRQTRVAPS
jgi:hypothetical protein